MRNLPRRLGQGARLTAWGGWRKGVLRKDGKHVDVGLNEDQVMLQVMTQRFIEERAPIRALQRNELPGDDRTMPFNPIKHN